jgi:hypothetical protein
MTRRFTPAPQHQKQYTGDAVWQPILEAIASGSSLTSALKENPGSPSYAVAKQYLRDDAALAAAYRTAQQDRADRLAEELLELCDAEMPEGLDGPGRHAWVAQLRVKIDTRKWVAARLHSRAWGERIQVEVEQQISIRAALEQANARVIEGVVLSGGPSVRTVSPSLPTNE